MKDTAADLLSRARRCGLRVWSESYGDGRDLLKIKGRSAYRPHSEYAAALWSRRTEVLVELATERFREDWALERFQQLLQSELAAMATKKKKP